jgi:hypothetical protein
LRHGLRWGDLPQELGYGSGVTCWRRLRDWQALGIWAMLHQVVLNWLGDVDAIDWSRASIDSISVRAKRGGEHTGPNPTDRGKAGSKYHFLVDRHGVPLAVQLTAANIEQESCRPPLAIIELTPVEWRSRWLPAVFAALTLGLAQWPTPSHVPLTQRTSRWRR